MFYHKTLQLQIVLFFFIGTCVFVWYQVRPDSVVANLEPDQVFPYFLLTTIPAGLAGMTIAGVLAAAMSSLDSSINAISTVVVVDVLKSWLAKGRNDRFYLFAARCVGIGAAVLMIGGAILFSSIKKESMIIAITTMPPIPKRFFLDDVL